MFVNYLVGAAGLADEAVDFSADFEDSARADIFELASLCQLYLTQGRFELAIPTYYRLYEELGQSFLAKQGLEPRGETQKTAFVNQYAPLIAKQFSKVTKFTPAFRLAYAAVKGSAKMQLLAAEVTPTISYLNGTPRWNNTTRKNEEIGLNVLRNNCFLDHENEPITKRMIDDTVPGFLTPKTGRAARIFKLLGLPTTNIYDQMNQEILVLFAQE